MAKLWQIKSSIKYYKRPLKVVNFEHLSTNYSSYYSILTFDRFVGLFCPNLVSLGAEQTVCECPQSAHSMARMGQHSNLSSWAKMRNNSKCFRGILVVQSPLVISPWLLHHLSHFRHRSTGQAKHSDNL